MITKVITVCKEMFQARGYILTHEDNDDSGHFIRGITSKGNSVVVCILPDIKLNVDTLKSYYQLFLERELEYIILVYQQQITPSVRKLITEIPLTIELFHINELQYNLLKHELVPRHICIGRERQNVKNLPILKKTDPVARFLAFKTGDIIQINRLDGTLYLRYVK